MERSLMIVIAMVVIIIVTMVIQDISNKKRDMIKLEPDTWYYQYEINNELYISTTLPKKDSEDSEEWYHPKYGYKCLGGFYVADPESSRNIQEFQTE